MPAINLQPGDPLVLTLAADARLGSTSYVNDHIWELSLGGGEPPALAIQTTYGLRARSFRIFPRFVLQDSVLSDPATFFGPIHFKYLAPNFIRLACIPFQGINVELEYWVPSSQTLAGRAHISNSRNEPVALLLEWAALLTPDPDGQRMAPAEMNLVHLLVGKTSSLTPIFYVEGICQPGTGPYPSLAIKFDLDAHGSQSTKWFTSALDTPQGAYLQAHAVAQRNWDAETALIELTNASQLEIQTGNPDWDAAFTLAQNTARSLVTTNPGNCLHPSTVSTRLPDQGHSLRGDGSDYNHLWDGQTPFDLYYLIGLIMPGEADLVRGFLENFLEAQSPNGDIPRKIGLTGQLGKMTAPPILAVLVWQYYLYTQDKKFLIKSFPKLLAFLQFWFSPNHDRDIDGIPEWDHLYQAGLDDHPVYAYFHPWSQGLNISMVESPDLCAYLYAEIQSLLHIATLIDQPETIPALTSLSTHLAAAIETSWNDSTCIYQVWDRESHRTSSPAILGERQGAGAIQLNASFDPPVRLLIQVRSKDEGTRPAQGFIHGTGPSGGHRVERIAPERFRWHLGIGRYTSERVYSHIEHIEVQGLLDSDQVTIQTPYLNCREQSLLLPLWAGIPSTDRALKLIHQTITKPQIFWGKYGLRTCAEKSPFASAAVQFQYIHMYTNSLIGEGMLRYGKQNRAADLVKRLMEAVVLNLKQKHSFFSSYSASNGDGIGERNALSGLAPLGLFMQVLGVQIISPYHVKITSPNPFPWPVSVKYKGLTVIQHKKKALIIFPDGQNVTIRNDKPQLVSLTE